METEIKLKHKAVNFGNMHLPAPCPLQLIIFLSELRMNVFRDLGSSQGDSTSSFRLFGVASLNLIIGFSGLTTTLLRGLLRGFNFLIRIRIALFFLVLFLGDLLFGRLKSKVVSVTGGVRTLLRAVEKSQSSKFRIGGMTGLPLKFVLLVS